MQCYSCPLNTEEKKKTPAVPAPCRRVLLSKETRDGEEKGEVLNEGDPFCAW